MKKDVKALFQILPIFCMLPAVTCGQESFAFTSEHRAVLENLSRLDGLPHEERDRVNYYVSLAFANAKDIGSTQKSIESIQNRALQEQAAQRSAILFAVHNMPTAAFDLLNRDGLATPERITLTFLAASNDINIATAQEFAKSPQISRSDRCLMLSITAGNCSDVEGVQLLDEVRQAYPLEINSCTQDVIQSLFLLGKINEAKALATVGVQNRNNAASNLDTVLSGLIPRSLKRKDPQRTIQIASAINGLTTRRLATAELMMGLNPPSLSEEDVVALGQLAHDAQLNDEYRLFICRRLLYLNEPKKALKVIESYFLDISSQPLNEDTCLEFYHHFVDHCDHSGQDCRSQALIDRLEIDDSKWSELGKCHLNILRFDRDGTAPDALDALLTSMEEHVLRTSITNLVDESRRLALLLEDMRRLSLSPAQKKILVGAIRNIASRLETLDPFADRFELWKLGNVVLGELAVTSGSDAVESYNEFSEATRRALSDAFCTHVLNSGNLDDVLGKCTMLSVTERVDLKLRTVIHESVLPAIQGLVYDVE